MARMRSDDLYGVLGVDPAASSGVIKAAYRTLVKRHHPDAGGDQEAMRTINAAWEVLGDGERRREYDRRRSRSAAPAAPARATPAETTAAARRRRQNRTEADADLVHWLQRVYAPIDRLLGQVINPFPGQLRSLAADPYDDVLMEAFCEYLEQSRRRLDTVENLFRSTPTPPAARDFGLSLYHCLAQVQDAIAELDRYTMGYVDGYLSDGREMLREARRRRSELQRQRRRLDLS
jgi:molecular chaperone DnaJ